MFEIFGRLGLALGLGLLVGLQRQRTDARLAGFRTFPLVTLAGALCSLVAQQLGGLVVAGGLVALAVVILGGQLPLLSRSEEQPGVTTEVTMLVMFLLGAYIVFGALTVAIASCGAVVVLLYLKPQLHSLAEKIGEGDFRVIMQFALISLVILPVLPNREYGPFAVFNPFKLWLMVVLIVGISLGGYVIYKVLGARGGAWASGVLGGLISSTATAVGVSRRSKDAPDFQAFATFVILISSAVAFLRVALLIAANDMGLFREAIGPCVGMCSALVLAGLTQLRANRAALSFVPKQENPSELKPALLFMVLYAAVLLGGAAANAYLGARGLLAVAALSGLADMDAVTLSISHLVSRGEVARETGWQLLFAAATANLIFKTTVVAVMGSRGMWIKVAGGFAVAVAVGVAWNLAGSI